MSESSGETRSVVLERVFPQPVDKVWRALTDASLLRQWRLDNDFEPEAGRSFRFRNEPMPQWDGVIDCEVLEVVAMERLSYNWRALGLESVVSFTLAPVDGGTWLRMEHSGFRQSQEAAYKGAGYGWQRFLGNLQQMLERG